MKEKIIIVTIVTFFTVVLITLLAVVVFRPLLGLKPIKDNTGLPTINVNITHEIRN